MTITLRMPAEWAPHDRVFIGFPHIAAEWEGALADAQGEIARFADAVADDGRGEQVMLVANDDDSAACAQQLVGPHVTVIVEPLGDAWLRDTAAIVVGSGDARQGRDFGFNWWGGKYATPGDDSIGGRLARRFGPPARPCDWIFEGGSIDVDGTGLGVTTEECLLAENRNPGVTRADIEAMLNRDLGIDRLLWLGKGLVNDHTDGHVDNLARFVGPNTLALPEAGEDDPNEAILADAKARAQAFGVTVVPMPSAGRVVRGGEIVPASYMNFYVGNTVVAMPAYGLATDAAAVAALQGYFPSRKVVPVRADAILVGGGSLHCISQQIPA